MQDFEDQAGYRPWTEALLEETAKTLCDALSWEMVGRTVARDVVKGEAGETGLALSKPAWP